MAHKIRSLKATMRSLVIAGGLVLTVGTGTVAAYDGQNPSSCASPTTVRTVTLTKAGTTVGTGQLRYSSGCLLVWTRVCVQLYFEVDTTSPSFIERQGPTSIIDNATFSAVTTGNCSGFFASAYSQGLTAYSGSSYRYVAGAGVLQTGWVGDFQTTTYWTH